MPAITSQLTSAINASAGTLIPNARLTARERQILAARFSDLTTREHEVLVALCEGGTNDKAARRLCVSLATLRTHLMRLHRKLGTARKSDLIAAAFLSIIDAYRTGELFTGDGSERHNPLSDNNIDRPIEGR